MPPSRPYDALYDPLYMASDPRDYQISRAISSSQTQRLPRFSNFFSELPNHPSHYFRIKNVHSLPDALFGQTQTPSRPDTSPIRSSTSPMRPLRVMSEGGMKQGPMMNGTCTAPPMSFQETSSPKIYSPTRSHSGLKSPPRSIPAKQLSGRMGSSGDWMDYNVLAERMKMKQDFEASLPPLSDTRSLSERKKMLEAWEKAEWSARETQLQALQEEQLQAFQAEVVAQDGKAEQMISQRLLSRQSGGTPKSQYGQSQRTPYSKQAKGGRGPGKQRRLTPLESFVHSNTPLQGRSLFKSKSQDAGDLQLVGLLSKSQTTTKTLPSGGGALRSASDIGAYRPQAGQTAARKEAAYAQHLDNVHRAILQEKELEARQAIASQIASPPEPHPKAFLEHPAMMDDDAMMTNDDITMAHDNGAAQVLVLGSRGSTAEGWLTTPESASSPVRSLLKADSAPTEATEEAQLPLPQEGSETEWLDNRLIPADINNGDAATKAAAAEEALPGQPAEVEAGAEDILPLESAWDNSRQVDSPVEDIAVWVSPEGSAAVHPGQALAQGDITGAVAEETAPGQLENGGQVEKSLPVKEALAAVAEEYADEPLAESAVEEFKADEESADKLPKDDVEVEGAPVEETSLAPEEEELVRPDTKINAIVYSLTEIAAAQDVPAKQEGEIEVSDSEVPKADPINAGTDLGAMTLDHLISQHHRQSSLLASAGVDSQVWQDAVAADSTELRPATAVSQTVNELVAAAEAHLPLLLELPPAEVQDAEEQISPADPVPDGHLALAPDNSLLPLLLAVPAAEEQGTEEQVSPEDPPQDGHTASPPDNPFEMAADHADISLFGAASPTVEQPLDTTGISADNYPVDIQLIMAEAETVGVPEAPAEIKFITIEESDATRTTLADLVEEGSKYANTAGHADLDPAVNLQRESDAAIETAALGPTDTEAQLEEAEAQHDNEVYDDSSEAEYNSEGKADLPQTVDEVVEESIGGLVEDAIASL